MWNPQILVFKAVCFHRPGTRRWGNLDLLRVLHEMSQRNWQVDPLWRFPGSCLPGVTSEVHQGTSCTDPEPARRKRRNLYLLSVHVTDALHKLTHLIQEPSRVGIIEPNFIDEDIKVRGF